MSDTVKIEFGTFGSDNWDQWDPYATRPAGAPPGEGWWSGEPGKVRPRDVNDLILYEDPNGECPLTAISARLKSKPASDPEIIWLTKRLPLESGFISETPAGGANGIYTAIGMGGGDVYAPVAGAPGDIVTAAGIGLYISCNELCAEQFKEGQQVMFLSDPDTNPTGEIVDTHISPQGEVMGVNRSGDNSYIHVQLITPDVITPSGHNLSHANKIWNIGNMFEEGSEWGPVAAYLGKEMSNQTQIFKEPYAVTGTALETAIRGQFTALEEKRYDNRKMYARHVEKALIFGQRSKRVGPGGQPKRTMDGIRSLIFKGDGVVSDFRSAIAPNGITFADGEGSWEKSGMDWFDVVCAEASRWSGQGLQGSSDLIGFCGHYVPLHFQRNIKAYATYNLQVNVGKFGIQVKTLSNYYLTIHLKVHPLFSHESGLMNSMLVFAPGDIVRRPMRGRDTKFFTDPRLKSANTSSYNFIDGIKEGLLSEQSIEYHYPMKGMWLDGIGLDRPEP